MGYNSETEGVRKRHFEGVIATSESNFAYSFVSLQKCLEGYG